MQVSLRSLDGLWTTSSGYSIRKISVFPAYNIPSRGGASEAPPHPCWNFNWFHFVWIKTNRANMSWCLQQSCRVWQTAFRNSPHHSHSLPSFFPTHLQYSPSFGLERFLQMAHRWLRTHSHFLEFRATVSLCTNHYTLKKKHLCLELRGETNMWVHHSH